MDQMSFGDAEFANKKKRTRREVFLAEMEEVVPWKGLVKLIEPFYCAAERGRRPYPLKTMLRIVGTADQITRGTARTRLRRLDQPELR